MDLDDQAEPVVRVWSSPMRRCLQTAVPLAAALGCPSVVAEADICEVGGHHRATGEPPAPSGVDLAFEHSGFVDTSRLPGGLGSAQVRAVGPLLQPGGAAGLSASHGVCRGQQRGQPWWSAGDDSTAEGVEQAMSRAYRVGEEMLRVAQAGQTDVLVAVSHDGFIQLLLSALLVAGRQLAGRGGRGMGPLGDAAKEESEALRDGLVGGAGEGLGEGGWLAGPPLLQFTLMNTGTVALDISGGFAYSMPTRNESHCPAGPDRMSPPQACLYSTRANTAAAAPSEAVQCAVL